MLIAFCVIFGLALFILVTGTICLRSLYPEKFAKLFKLTPETEVINNTTAELQQSNAIMERQLNQGAELEHPRDLPESEPPRGEGNDLTGIATDTRSSNGGDFSKVKTISLWTVKIFFRLKTYTYNKLLNVSWSYNLSGQSPCF